MDTSLLELNRSVINGTSDGRIIWQPRIISYFDDREFNGIPYEAPYTGMDRYDIYRNIGCSDRSYQFGACIQPVFDDRVRTFAREIDPLHYEHTIYTPVGNINSIYRKNRSNPGVYPEKWFVTNEEDMKVLIFLEETTNYRFDKTFYDHLYASYADLGLPTLYIPRVNIQKLFHEHTGIEGAIYALQDYTDTTEACFAAMFDNQNRYIDVLMETPIEWVNFADNLHCGLLPPSLFEKYVLPVYQHRNERLHKKGYFTFSHWDGDCKALLPYAKETGLDGIEAITPDPQGDVTLKEAKKYMGDMFLLDGIASLLFNEMYPVEELEKQVRECIDLFAPHLVLGISDEMPSSGNIDRVKFVQEIVDDYNSRC